MMGIWTIARLTFDGAARRRVLWALLLLGVAGLLLYALGLAFVYGEAEGFIQQDPDSPMVQVGLNFFLMAGLYAANFLIVMVTVLISIDTIAGEISNETIQSVAVKPVRRIEIVLGKWLGFAGILGVYSLLMVGGVMLLCRAIMGYAAPKPLVAFGVIYLESLLLLSVAFLGGTRLSTLANGAVVFGLHGLAFIGGWVGQFGALLSSDGARNIGKVSQAIMPTEGLWRYAASEMQPQLGGALLTRFSSPFSAGGAPGSEIISYAILFGAAALLLAVWQFNRRDL
jgi:ABC-type transport system involved in multi-copper enzyme maturation permease subunit